MSTPMFDVPEHFPVGVNSAGEGPVDESDPEFAVYSCSCGTWDCPEIDCPACDGEGYREDETACGDPDHCSPWLACGACSGWGVVWPVEP